ncbi:MAG: amidase [Myxococcales bacterium]|nr:amidase [Myxococcales bacterium]
MSSELPAPTAAPLFPLSVAQALARIEAREPELHAFISRRPAADVVAEAAARADEAPRSPLHGVPFSLKDEWETLDLPTTTGSWRHRARKSSLDSSVVQVFRAAGAVLLGKTNLSDLGLAPEATSWLVGATRNPLDLTRTAGGSSGGAAAAVADGMSGFDWGTDIGGSIRYPAALCGVFGLRLSSETWPITGMFPIVPPAMTWMCAQGPLARTLPQLRAVLDVARPIVRTGPARGPFQAREAVLYLPGAGNRWPRFADDVTPALARVVGAPNENHGLPSIAKVQWIFNGVWCSHLMDLLDAEPGLRLVPSIGAVLGAVVGRGSLGRGFHPATAEILLQIAVGRALLYHSKPRALAAAHAVRAGFQRLWDRGAVVVMPVCGWPAPRPGRTNWNPRLIECTVPGNLADATGLSIPWGTFDDGLPRALQLLGPPGSEDELIDLGERLLASPGAPGIAPSAAAA